MAMGAVAAHKLRSALTLLGVLVGVFSIIVVMTAMRAMKKKIESDLNQLGGQTFVVQTWPAFISKGRKAGKNIGGANASTSRKGWKWSGAPPWR